MSKIKMIHLIRKAGAALCKKFEKAGDFGDFTH